MARYELSEFESKTIQPHLPSLLNELGSDSTSGWRFTKLIRLYEFNCAEIRNLVKPLILMAFVYQLRWYGDL